MRGIPLATGYSTSAAVLIVDEALEIDFDLSCSAGPSTVSYFIEYSEDLVTWFAEVAEEDAGKGVVLMPKTVRTFADNNSTSVANNTGFKVSCQFTRPHLFARIQIAAAAGTVIVNSATSEFGLGPYGSVVVGTGGGGGGCTPGQVLYDSGVIPSEHKISSDEDPPNDVYVIDGLGPFPNCTNLRITVALDVKWALGPTPFPSSVWAYLNNSGMTTSDRSFIFAPSPPASPGTGVALATLAGGNGDGTYHSIVLNGMIMTVDTGLPYRDFAGPTPAMSVYFWVPVFFPDFSTGAYFVKNVRITVTTI